ncbi:MAG: MATE family efflux transporter [Vicinamibacterales bacterium]|nr:MATE family efflux transporter [Vicinamibacterales bacterium]
MADASPPPSRFDRSLVDGPILPAVWKLAWPTMLQNLFAGLQGVVDHVMVGNMVGYTANAAIGVSWQLLLVVVVFMASLFTGQAVLVARFAGAGDSDKVNRVVYQAFITAMAMFLFVMAPLGYVSAPWLLTLINAAPEVQAEALPFLRIMFTGSIGMMLFFMLSAALRAAGDAQTPMRLGVTMTVLNLVFNLVLIPPFGTVGAAIGTVSASGLVAAFALWHLFSGKSVIHLTRSMRLKPDFAIIRSLFRFGLPTGVQGIAMNLGGVMLLRFIGSLEQSAAAQAAYAIAYSELFSMITWTSVGLMGASATIAGQNLGAGKPDRAVQGVWVAARIGLAVAAVVGLMFVTIPQVLLAAFGATEPAVAVIGTGLLQYLAVSGFFVTVALTFTGGLQGTGDTKSPLYITLVSQVAIPIGLCSVLQAMRPLVPSDIWTAILLGHITRGTLSALRFYQGKWRSIVVE